MKDVGIRTPGVAAVAALAVLAAACPAAMSAPMKAWDRKQITPLHEASLALPLRLAARHWGDVRYAGALKKLAGPDDANASADDLLSPLTYE